MHTKYCEVLIAYHQHDKGLQQGYCAKRFLIVEHVSRKDYAMEGHYAKIVCDEQLDKLGILHLGTVM